MPTLPTNPHSIGDSGHVNDHNTMNTALAAAAYLSSGNIVDVTGATTYRFGKILQVVFAGTTTVATTSGTTLVDSNVTATITPVATTSKVLAIVAVNGGKVPAINTGIKLALLRGTTNLAQFGTFHGLNTASTDTNFHAGSVQYLDSPATTSATTYKVQFCRNGGSGTVEVQNNSAYSSIVLLEVGA